MSQTSPSDLVAAFRSFPRRLDAALGALDDDPSARSVAEPHAAELARVIGEAAATMGAAGGSDLGGTAGAVADAISAVDAERWDETRLDRLRALALDAGRALRSVEMLAP